MREKRNFLTGKRAFGEIEKNRERNESKKRIFLTKGKALREIEKSKRTREKREK